MNEKRKVFIINSFYVVIWSLIIYFVLKFTLKILFPFLIGIFIAYIVQRPAHFLSGKIKIKKEICAAILSVLIYIFVLLIVVLLIWYLFSKTSDFLKFLSTQGEIFKAFIYTANNFFEKITYVFNGDVGEVLKKLFEDMTNNFVLKIGVLMTDGITKIFKATPGFLLSCVVTVVATFYISKDFFKLKLFLKNFISQKAYENVVEIKTIFINCILKFIAGYSILMLITFFELLIGLFLLNIKHFFIISLIIAVVDIVPILGTGTILLPWSAICFLQNNFRLGVGILILYLVVSIVRNFTEPKIIGDQIGINPLFMLVFMFIGIKLAGLAGMLALPILLIIIYNFYKKRMPELRG